MLPVVKPRAADKRIKVSTYLPTDVPTIIADRQVHQVLLNLLTNAIKYTRENGNVSVEARTQDGFVEIWVTDTGIGIGREDIDRIFQRFTQVDSSASRLAGRDGPRPGHHQRARGIARGPDPGAEQGRQGLQFHLHQCGYRTSRPTIWRLARSVGRSGEP